MKHTFAILFGQLTLAATAGLLVKPPPATGALTAGGILRQEIPAEGNTNLRLAQGAPPSEAQQERRQAKMQEIESDLEKNPNLVDDPDYLKHHPGFAKMLEKHPQARERIKKDPQAFFQHMKQHRGQNESGSAGSEAGSQDNPD